MIQSHLLMYVIIQKKTICTIMLTTGKCYISFNTSLISQYVLEFQWYSVYESLAIWYSVYELSHYPYVQFKQQLYANEWGITKECNTRDLEAWRTEQILKNLINRSTGHQNFQESCIHLSPSHLSSLICRAQLVSLDHLRFWTL